MAGFISPTIREKFAIMIRKGEITYGDLARVGSKELASEIKKEVELCNTKSS